MAMVDLTSLRLNSIWVPQHIMISATPIENIREETEECFFFLQITVTECLPWGGRGVWSGHRQKGRI